MPGTDPGAHLVAVEVPQLAEEGHDLGSGGVKDCMHLGSIEGAGAGNPLQRQAGQAARVAVSS